MGYLQYKITGWMDNNGIYLQYKIFCVNNYTAYNTNGIFKTLQLKILRQIVLQFGPP